MPYKDPIISKIKARERGIRWVIKNPDKVKEKEKRYRLKNHDKVIARTKAWRVLNKEKALEASKRWKKNNPDKVNETKRIYNNKKYSTDIQYKLSVVLRSRLRLALKNGQKRGSAVKLLGCTIEELKIYIENKFQQGMTWGNWSRNGWHIDHDIPLYKFNLMDLEQLARACHYTNLQPMWAMENYNKNKYI